MDRAEELIHEIEPGQAYPLEYVIFRITSFRPEQTHDDVFQGKELLGDLARFVERLSATLLWPADAYRPRVALTLDETCALLGVGKTTIHRYRQQGLVAHKVRGKDNDQASLVFFRDAIERFSERHRDSVRRAGEFSRIDGPTRARMIARARAYRTKLGWSLQKAAHRLANRYGRSEEAVRLLLKKHDERYPDDAVFRVAGRLDERTRRLIARAMRHGVPVGEIVERTGRSRHTVYRVWNEFRAERVLSYALPTAVLPTFEMDEAAEVLLSPTQVRCGLLVEHPGLGGDLVEWQARVMAGMPPIDEEELSSFGALYFLCYEAGRQRAWLTAMTQGPGAGVLNNIETMLLWAGRLKHRLMVRYLRPALVVVEQHLGGPLVGRGRAEVLGLHRLMIHTISRSIDSFHPERGQHFTAYMNYQMARALAQVSLGTPGPGNEPRALTTAARARRSGGALWLPESVQQVSPWYADLDLPESLKALVGQLADEVQRLVMTRLYGLDGARPMTAEELAATAGGGSDLPTPPTLSTAAQVSAAAGRALRELRRMRRGRRSETE